MSVICTTKGPIEVYFRSDGGDQVIFDFVVLHYTPEWHSPLTGWILLFPLALPHCST